MSRGTWYRWNKKATNEDFHRFSISGLKREKLIGRGIRCSSVWQWLRNGNVVSSIGYEINTLGNDPWLRVHYQNKRTGKDYDYKIKLVTTQPNYGGERWWFLCPAHGCNRRVGVLFLGQIFACRHCHNIAYATQNQAAYDRMCDRAFKIARQLGHEGNVIEGFYGSKPTGMHWKTYNRKMAEMNQLAEIGLAGAMARFGAIF